MSTVVVLTPIIIANWPVIAAAVTAAVGTMGFTLIRSGETDASSETATREVIEVDNSDILPSAAGRKSSWWWNGRGCARSFTRDARGTLRVCLEGAGYSRAELRQIGQELVDRVTQQYVYHRVVTELKARHMTIVDESVAEDRTVKIRVRSW